MVRELDAFGMARLGCLCTPSRARGDWRALLRRAVAWGFPLVAEHGGARRAFRTNDTVCLPDRIRAVQWSSGDYWFIFLFLGARFRFLREKRSESTTQTWAQRAICRWFQDKAVANPWPIFLLHERINSDEIKGVTDSTLNLFQNFRDVITPA